jgi:hypothetical protein
VVRRDERGEFPRLPRYTRRFYVHESPGMVDTKNSRLRRHAAGITQ